MVLDTYVNIKITADVFYHKFTQRYMHSIAMLGFFKNLLKIVYAPIKCILGLPRWWTVVVQPGYAFLLVGWAEVA